MSNARLTRRLARVEAAASPAAPSAPHAPLVPADESRDLAAEMTAAFARSVRSYRETYQSSVEEALAKTAGKDPAVVEAALSRPAESVHWFDLNAVAGASPEDAYAKWLQVKEAARDELRDGYRASRAVEADGLSCWARAQFLALRDEITEAWRPRDGLEQQLVDQLAQFQTLLGGWQQILALWMSLADQGMRQARKARNGYEQTRLSDAESVEQAAAMVERFHALYLRTLRALQAQRRLGPVVIVRRANQVNVGQQQVNVTL